MKVLMFGWEFPPFNTGGLGTACFGLTRGLSNHGVEATFVLPKAGVIPEKSHVKLIAADSHGKIKGIKIRKVDSLLVPYADSSQYDKKYSQHNNISSKNKKTSAVYGSNLYEEVQRYAANASLVAKV